MELKYNVWHIDGYVGNNECDGPNDFNVHKDYIVNSEYKKEQVISMFNDLYKGYREIIVGKCRLISNGAITYKE